MSRKRAGKCRRFNTAVRIVAGLILVVCIAAVGAFAIVRSENHPRMTTIDPHSTLKPVATQPAPTTATTAVPETTQTDEAPALPAETPSFSENPIPPSSTSTTPSWSVPAPTGSRICIGERPYQSCWKI